jgi:hypothetical protein
MKLEFAISWLKAAKRHFSEHKRYRWWPLYSACLAVFIYSTCYWPWSKDVLIAYRLEPWLIWLDRISWDSGLYLCIGLGVVGLMRSSWIARGLSIYGIWVGQYFLTPNLSPLAWAWKELTWYTVDLPDKLINSYTGEGTAASMFLWFMYLVMVWIVLRPIFKRAYVHVRKLEARILDRWPVMNRFAKPVM